MTTPISVGRTRGVTFADDIPGEYAALWTTVVPGEGMEFRATHIWSVLLLAGLSAAGPPAALATTPTVESLGVEGGTVAGREGTFVVRAADPAAAVSGLVLSFEGEVFGSSACRLAGPNTRPAQAPFAAGSPVVLTAPHRFGAAGTSDGVVRVDSGGCARPTGSVLQPFTATVTEPGQPTQPLVLGPPVLLPELPVDVPVDVPEIPGLPDLPPLGPLDDPLGALPARQPCDGARSVIRRSVASRRRAQTAVHCLLNRERQHRGLRPLGEDARLLHAAGAHSRAMVRGGFFSHFGTTPPGRTLVERLRRSHYLPARAYVVGENIAYGSGGGGTPASILRAWMHSTSHRANILGTGFREVGVGIEVGSPVAPNRGVTYTTDFGRRR